ncbi:MAG: hypothetical protein AAFQ09_04915, partial [Pseudomonadota bacterium]
MLKRTLSAIACVCAIIPVSPAIAEIDAGAYLAGRQAGAQSDFANSARFYTKALLQDPSNSYMLENAMTSFIALGQFNRSIPIAQVMVEQGFTSQIAHLALSVQSAKDGLWSDIFSRLEQGQSVGPLVDGLVQGWAHLGQRDMSRALASFDQVIESRGMEVYGITHKAYAMASVGDFETAAALFESPVSGGLRYSRNSAIAHAQILSQLGRNDDALAVLDAIFGKQLDPAVVVLRDALSAG